MIKPVKKQIVNREYFRHPSCPRSGRGSVLVTLSCGHQNSYKFSESPKGDYAFCKDCPRVAAGLLIEGAGCRVPVPGGHY